DWKTFSIKAPSPTRSKPKSERASLASGRRKKASLLRAPLCASRGDRRPHRGNPDKLCSEASSVPVLNSTTLGIVSSMTLGVHGTKSRKAIHQYRLVDQSLSTDTMKMALVKGQT